MKRVTMVVLIGLAVLGAVYAGTKPEDWTGKKEEIGFLMDVEMETKPEDMTREQRNKIIVRVAIGALNKGDWETLREVYSYKYVQHWPGNKKQINWIQFEKNCREVQKALPNLRYKIEDIIAEGDKVAVRMSSCATLKAEKPGGYSVGKKFEMTEIDVLRIEDDRIVEGWVEYDRENLRTQLRPFGYGGKSPEDAAKEYMEQMDYLEDFTDALKMEMDKRTPRR